jgi:hypothetical protein
MLQDTLIMRPIVEIPTIRTLDYQRPRTGSRLLAARSAA